MRMKWVNIFKVLRVVPGTRTAQDKHLLNKKERSFESDGITLYLYCGGGGFMNV